MGQSHDLPKNYKLIEHMAKPNHSPFDFINWNHYGLKERIYRKTVAFEIANTYPYNEISSDFLLKKHMDNFLPADKLLEYFSKYQVDKIENSDDNLVVEL